MLQFKWNPEKSFVFSRYNLKTAQKKTLAKTSNVYISISNSSLSVSPFTANDHDHGDPLRLICSDDSISIPLSKHSKLVPLHTWMGSTVIIVIIKMKTFISLHSILQNSLSLAFWFIVCDLYSHCVRSSSTCLYKITSYLLGWLSVRYACILCV